MVWSTLGWLLGCTSGPSVPASEPGAAGVAPPTADVGASHLTFLEDPVDTTIALPLVMALHGNGGTPERMMAMARSCGLPIRIVVPRGPRQMANGNFDWFDLNTPNPARFDVDMAIQRSDELGVLLGELAAERRVVGEPIVTGFSGGGVLTYGIAARFPHLVGSAVPVSAMIVPKMMPEVAGATLPPIRALQPENDRAMPTDVARMMIDRLRDRGVDAELRVLEGVGHEFAGELRDVWCETLAAVVPTPSPPARIP